MSIQSGDVFNNAYLQFLLLMTYLSDSKSFINSALNPSDPHLTQEIK